MGDVDLMKKVDICESNFALGTDKVKDELEKSSGYEVEVHGCLGRCGECFETPFVLLDGDFVSADSCDELLNKVKK